jgi:uncharacterized membrane protein
MSEGLVPELQHAVDLMAQSRATESEAAPVGGLIAEADHILGPILEHAEPSHIYTDHLLGPDHTDAPHESAYVEVVHPAPTQLEPAQMEPAYAAAPTSLEAHPVEPSPAQPAVLAQRPEPTAPRRLNMAQSAETVVDPVLAGFDHVVALVCYGLLFISVFLLGIPALAAAALAFAHKRDAHVIVATHYRFQLRIFWTTVLLLLLAAASAFGASAIALDKLFNFVRDHLPGMSGVVSQGAAWAVPLAGGLTLAAIVFLVLAVAWMLLASLIGFFRLLANKPIGHLPATA